MRDLFRLMVLAAVTLAVLGGCDLRTRDRVVLLQDAVKEFGVSIRWAEHEYARNLMRPRHGPAITRVPAVMKQIRVTAWSSGEIVMEPEGRDATVDIRFSFYHETAGRLVELGQKQVWYFNVTENRWFIDGGFPDFAGAWKRSR